MTQGIDANRRLVTARQITCNCFVREDGLWDIEGTLIDTRTVDIPLPTGELIKAGSPVHEMRLRLTIDVDRKIHYAKAVTTAGAMPACVNVNSAYKALEGLTIGPGFNAKAQSLLGGIRGCSHLTELMGRLASAACVAVFPTQVHFQHRGATPIDACYSWRRSGEGEKVLWPAYQQVLQKQDWK